MSAHFPLLSYYNTKLFAELWVDMASIPTLDRLLGGYLITICGALILYGLCTAQSYIYMLNCKEDGRLLKSVVLIVWILESAHTGFVIHMTYHYTITAGGSILGINEIVWSVGAAFISELLIIILVQCFYLRRVWILSKQSYIIVGFTSLLLVVRTAFGLGTSVLLYIVPTWTQFHEQHGPMTTISGGLSFSVAVDLIITSFLVFYFRRGQTETKFRMTHDIIRICMVYAVNTGALTMIVSMLILVTFCLVKNSLLFAGLTLIASKLYANSFLGTLNARQILRRKNEEAHWQDTPLTGSLPSALKPIKIYQETIKTVENDSGQRDYINDHPFKIAV